MSLDTLSFLMLTFCVTSFGDKGKRANIMLLVVKSARLTALKISNTSLCQAIQRQKSLPKVY